MNHLLKLQNIFKTYKSGDDEIFALNDVSLSIDYGDFLAIIGQSGSG